MTRLLERPDAAVAEKPGRTQRIVDLTLPIKPGMPGVTISAAKILERDGWNASTLSIYSHAGTHVDAPCHFLDGGATLDNVPLEVLWGPAKVLDLTPVQPGELLTVEKLQRWEKDIRPGDRLLLRTDWHRTYGTESYRNALPRISLELAHWLVAKQVALVGVEPPSIADVNNLAEVTAVHHVLFNGNVVIVEGLANLDVLQHSTIEFLAVPLRIAGGDGSPVRALARELEW